MNKIVLILLVTSSLIFGCATKSKPYTGESVSQSMSEGGVETTVVESRSLMADGALAGKELTRQQVVATVVDINKKSRKLTLKKSNGEVADFEIGSEVQNFDQIQKNDLVKLEYTEVISFEARKPTEQEKLAAQDAYAITGRAEKGDKPSALIASGGVAILSVESIQKEEGTLTLRDGDDVFTVDAKYPENLDLLKKGDPIVVNFSEMLAVSVKTVNK